MTPTREEARAAIEAYVDDRHDSAIDALRALFAVPSDNSPGDCATPADHHYRPTTTTEAVNSVGT